MSGKYNVIILFALLLCNRLIAQKSPKEVFEAVAQKVVSMSNTQHNFVQMPFKQHYMQLIKVTNDKKYHEFKTTVIVPNSVDKSNVRLAFCFSKSKVKVRWNEKTLMDQNVKKSSSPTLLDYELIQYQHVFSPVIKDTNEFVITVFNTQTPQIYYDLILPTGMQLKDWSTLPKNTGFYYKSAHQVKDLPSEEYRAPEYLDMPVYEATLDYSDWKYFTGILHYTMLREGKTYQDFVRNHYNAFFNNIDLVRNKRKANGMLEGLYWSYFRGTMLDDYGPQIAALLSLLKSRYNGDIKQIKKDPWYRTVDEHLQKLSLELIRLKDGTFARDTPTKGTVQSDDLIMGGLLVLSAYETLGEKKYLDEAYKQALQFHNYLYEEKSGLYRHAYSTADNQQSTSCWNRGMGWAILAQSLILEHTDHPHYQTLLSIHLQLLKNVAGYVSSEGMLHQVLDDTATYKETSGTAMYLYCLATATRKGLLDEHYAKLSHILWKGLSSQIDDQGNVSNIVRGTPILENNAAYNKQAVRLNDPRGMGAVLMACRAYDKLTEKND